MVQRPSAKTWYKDQVQISGKMFLYEAKVQRLGAKIWKRNTIQRPSTMTWYKDLVQRLLPSKLFDICIYITNTCYIYVYCIIFINIYYIYKSGKQLQQALYSVKM